MAMMRWRFSVNMWMMRQALEFLPYNTMTPGIVTRSSGPGTQRRLPKDEAARADVGGMKSFSSRW